MIETAKETLFDAHLHLWDPDRISMSWMDDTPALNRAFLASDLKCELGPHARRFAGAVLVESAVDELSLDRELEWIASQLESSDPVRVAVAGWRPRSGIADVLRRLDALDTVPGVVGVRQVMHSSSCTSSALLEDDHVRSVRLAGDRGYLVELCVRPDQLEAAIELVDRSPGTRFVLDHLGRPRTTRPLDHGWADSMARLSDRSRLTTKLSALIECAEGSDLNLEDFQPFVKTALDRFGDQRVMWGSNWPVCFTRGSLSEWIDVSDRFLGDRSPDQRAAILGGNARRIYGIS